MKNLRTKLLTAQIVLLGLLTASCEDEPVFETDYEHAVEANGSCGVRNVNRIPGDNIPMRNFIFSLAAIDVCEKSSEEIYAYDDSIYAKEWSGEHYISWKYYNHIVFDLRTADSTFFKARFFPNYSGNMTFEEFCDKILDIFDNGYYVTYKERLAGQSAKGTHKREIYPRDITSIVKMPAENNFRSANDVQNKFEVVKQYDNTKNNTVYNMARQNISVRKK